MGENESLWNERHFYYCVYVISVPFSERLRALLMQVFRQLVIKIYFNPVCMSLLFLDSC